MNIIKLFILSLYHFFMEMLFDRKEGKKFTDRTFNPRKWLAVLIMIGSLLLNIILIMNLMDLRHQVDDLEYKLKSSISVID